MSETLSRSERFKRAQEARAKAQAEKSSGDFGSIEVPQFKTLALNPNKSHVIRVLGEALEMHEKPTDMIQIEKSLICDDDGKWFNVIWSNDTNHPMNKLRKTILGKYKYDRETKTKEYDNKDLEVFKIWQTNRQENPSPYSNGMNPNRYILMNVIDRDDDWCKENKHSKLLCWSSTTQEKDGKVVEYPEYGVKPSLWNTIWDEKCTSAMVHSMDTDFVVRRLDKKTKMAGAKGDVYLQVCLPEEKSVIRAMEQKDGCTYLDKVSEDELSEEELSYELYELENIPFVSLPTPCGVIMKHLEKLIKLTDKTFNTTLWDEFVELKKKETEEFNAKKDEEKKNAPITNETKVEETTESEVESNDDLPTEVEEPSFDKMKEVETPTVKVAKKVVKSSFDVMKYVDQLPELANMSEKDRTLITGISEEGVLTFKDNDVAECPTCGNDIHSDMTHCVYCGQDFEE